MPVERFRVGIDRVDDNELAARDPRGVSDRVERAYEEFGTESLAMEGGAVRQRADDA